MSDVVYESRVKIERIGGPDRLAHLPATDEPVPYGVHGAIADHYGVKVKTPTATTIDHVVAAAGG